MKTLFTALLEKALRRYLQLDPDVLTQMERLSGKVIKVMITEINASLYLFPDAEGINIRSVYDQQPDAEIKGSLFILLFASNSVDQSTQVRQQIELSGDIELAQKFSHILQQRHIDWEEPLSRVIGDIAAHQIGNTVRGINNWRKQASNILCENLTEYVQEDLKLFPPREEMEDFFADIYQLRNDTERLAARLSFLQQEVLSK